MWYQVYEKLCNRMLTGHYILAAVFTNKKLIHHLNKTNYISRTHRSYWIIYVMVTCIMRMVLAVQQLKSQHFYSLLLLLCLSCGKYIITSCISSIHSLNCFQIKYCFTFYIQRQILYEGCTHKQEKLCFYFCYDTYVYMYM